MSLNLFEKRYTHTEVASLLHMSPACLYVKVRNGEILAYKNGKRFEYREADLQAYLQSRPLAGPRALGAMLATAS